MMKRLLSVLLLVCLLVSALPVQAESPTDALYLLVLLTEQGETSLGTGVLYGDRKTLLTAADCTAAGDLYAVGYDAQILVERTEPVEGMPLTLLHLSRESKAQPLGVSRSTDVMAGVLLGADCQGEALMPVVTHQRRSLVAGHDGVLLSADQGLMPGAVMVGLDGGIACMVVAEHGEGRGVYQAVTNVGLSALLEDGSVAKTTNYVLEGAEEIAAAIEAEAAAANAIQPGVTETGLVRGFTTSLEKGVLTVDWTEAAATVAGGTAYTVYLVTGNNLYLTYEVAREGAQVSFAVLPETEVMVWIGIGDADAEPMVYPDYTPGTYEIIATGAAQPYTLNDFRNVRMSVTPYAGTVTEMPGDFLPQQPITREVLADRSVPLYFQTEDTYSVTEQSEDHAMVIALCTPEGYTFSYESQYVFMPTLTESDLWVLDMSPLFAWYEQFVPEEERWPAGDYAVLYCIDGCVAAEFIFSVAD